MATSPQLPKASLFTPALHHLQPHLQQTTTTPSTLAFFTEESLYAGFEKAIMSEVTFAKTFLATCDKRPIKLPADHVSDARKYPSQSPFILPKSPHPFPSRPTKPSSQHPPPSPLTATLKPTRAGAGDTLSIPDISVATTTIHDLKTAYAERTGVAADRVKLLLNKKPAADLKTLKDLGVSGEAKDVELGVMLMGGGGATPARSPAAVEKPDPELSAPPAGERMDVDPAPLSEKAAEQEKTAEQPPGSAREILGTEEFWEDLRAFLAQRLRSEEEGGALAGTFREAWRAKG